MITLLLIALALVIAYAGYRSRQRRIARETTTNDLEGVFYFDQIAATTASTRRHH